MVQFVCRLSTVPKIANAKHMSETKESFADFPKVEPLLDDELVHRQGSPDPDSKGIELLYRSAVQNCTLAQTVLGLLHYEGHGSTIKQSGQEARYWFLKAAGQGDAVAQYYLGELYFDGNGVREDTDEAFRWYKQSANNGYRPAQQKLAHCYLNGIGTQKNEAEGYLLLASLALQGDEEALTLLRSAAIAGKSPGVQSDAEFAISCFHRERNEREASCHWLEKSAAKGNPQALCMMAKWYEDQGDTVQKMRYYRLAAENGNPEAQAHLGLLLENCTDRKALENKESFRWIQAAAAQGHPKAWYFLGNFYRDGTWVSVDYEKSLECYAKSAALGDDDGLDRLGEAYRYGIGAQKNDERAFDCFRQAAAMGNPKGQFHLGLCYLEGAACLQDMEAAFQWISLAASSGHPGIADSLKQLGLDLEQFSDGYRRHCQVQALITGNRFGENFRPDFQ